MATNTDDVPPKKKRRLSLSLSKHKERFSVTSNDELIQVSKAHVPKNTCAAVKWAFRLFSDWIGHGSDVCDRQYTVEDLWDSENPEKVCEMLSLFCTEVMQQNGERYTPKSLLQILINLQKYAKGQSENAFHFMNQKDGRFKALHNTLDNVSRELHKSGVGTCKIQARTITRNEEERLWASGVMGTSTPESLLNAVFFYCGIYLCLRGGDEHRGLKYSQFEFDVVENPENTSETIKIVKYTEHGSKNRPGTMHQVHLQNKVVIHYANASLEEKCFVHILETYMSKLPATAVKKDLFYCRALKNVPAEGLPWYCGVALGHNILKKKLSGMFLLAGLDAEFVSNHSLRATGVSWLYESGVPEQLIMERSGHLSISGVRSYERTTAEQQKKVSDVLSKDRKPLAILDNSLKGNPKSEPSSLATQEESGVDPCDALKNFSFHHVDGCVPSTFTLELAQNKID